MYIRQLAQKNKNFTVNYNEYQEPTMDISKNLFLK